MRNKNKSRRYRTMTHHFQRVPKDFPVGEHITYRNAEAFLSKWEQLYKESPLFPGMEISRTHDRVEARLNGKLIMAAYFEEEKQ